jgi:chorismate mutase-like protein
MDKAAPDPLQEIRSRIDAIDEAMHRLLIERSAVIAELIEIKGASKPGAAFRPDREADMMRRLVLRHDGALPLATVEHIWREIITTFTMMQAPFSIAAGPANDALALRDTIRFYFGFSIPIASCESAVAAIDRVVRSGREIAVVPADCSERWWASLGGSNKPQVFAKLPFIEIPDRPADLPAYVIGPPLREKPSPDILLYIFPDGPDLVTVIASYGGHVAGRAGGEALVELPIAVTPADIAKARGKTSEGVRYVGGFSQPIRYLAERIA